MDFLDKLVFGNSVKQILLALLVFLAFYGAFPIFKKRLANTIKRLAKKTQNRVDDLFVDIIKNFNNGFAISAGVLLAIQFLTFEKDVEKWVKFAVLALFLVEIIRAVDRIIDFGVETLSEKNKSSESAIEFAGRLLKMLVWVLGFLFLLQNLGVNVSSLIAGLGIGGIAVALALQSVLGDMFSSFSIFLDKPFKKGDYITIDSLAGTVKKIGIKTTRIESLTGEEIVIANQDLTNSRIQNYKRMKKRRGSFVLGVEYSTAEESLKKIPEIITKIIKEINGVELVRVYFKEFGDFSLNFEVVYWVEDSSYAVFCKKTEEVNYAIFEAFKEEEIIFAFPTQTLFMEKNTL
ncbi:MAG: mechanosensitive ion channel family protein [Candidatus Gracilibacteria bacterium]|jgi:small-conductance mechanosensitive channel|nr:mechanosensitive ion channel family protein [Candidatus Gracilibacteria bacterium]